MPHLPPLQANYATAKAGVNGLTKTVAKEWGPLNIRCNAIAYGAIDTRLTQQKEGGEAMSVGGRTVKLGIPQARRCSTVVLRCIGRQSKRNGRM